MNPNITQERPQTVISATIEWFLNRFPDISEQYTRLTISIEANPNPTMKKQTQAKTIPGDRPSTMIDTPVVITDAQSASLLPFKSV